MKLVFVFGGLCFSIVHSRIWWNTMKLESITMKYSNGPDTNLAAVIKGVKRL